MILELYFKRIDYFKHNKALNQILKLNDKYPHYQYLSPAI